MSPALDPSDERPPLPRPLNDDELDVLLRLLDERDFRGRDALLRQVPSTRVVGYCPCPCAAVDLAIDSGVEPALGVSYFDLPTASIFDDHGELLGTIDLIVRDGYLAGLELSYFDDPIYPMPPRERIVVSDVPWSYGV
jgi:hypothetical protein